MCTYRRELTQIGNGRRNQTHGWSKKNMLKSGGYVWVASDAMCERSRKEETGQRKKPSNKKEIHEVCAHKSAYQIGKGGANRICPKVVVMYESPLILGSNNKLQWLTRGFIIYRLYNTVSELFKVWETWKIYCSFFLNCQLLCWCISVCYCVVSQSEKVRKGKLC